MTTTLKTVFNLSFLTWRWDICAGCGFRHFCRCRCRCRCRWGIICPWWTNGRFGSSLWFDSLASSRSSSRPGLSSSPRSRGFSFPRSRRTSPLLRQFIKWIDLILSFRCATLTFLLRDRWRAEALNCCNIPWSMCLFFYFSPVSQKTEE